MQYCIVYCNVVFTLSRLVHQKIQSPVLLGRETKPELLIVNVLVQTKVKVEATAQSKAQVIIVVIGRSTSNGNGSPDRNSNGNWTCLQATKIISVSPK